MVAEVIFFVLKLSKSYSILFLCYVMQKIIMLKLDRTAKLQGDVNLFFVPQRPIFDINTKRQNNLGSKL